MTELGPSHLGPQANLGSPGPEGVDSPVRQLRLGGLGATAWAAGTLLGGWDLCQLAAGIQSRPSALLWTALGLLFAAGMLAVLRPLAACIPQSAALITSAGWICALVAGRMANSLAGGEAIFVLAVSLTCALTGCLATLVGSPQSGLPVGPSIPALLRRGGVTLLVLAGCFLAAWVLGAGRYRPALRLAVLPPIALVIGLTPGATARALVALGSRMAAAGSTLLQPGPVPQVIPPSREPTVQQEPEPSDPSLANRPEPKKGKAKKIKP